MKRLSEFLKPSAGCEVRFLPDVGQLAVSSLAVDSRAVKPGSLFFAIPGAKDHGERFIDEAIRQGAVAVVLERELEGLEFSSKYLDQVPVIFTDNVRELVSQAGAAFSDHPSKLLFSCAVTGTNGKTSVSWLLYGLLRELGLSPALVGTLGAMSATDASHEMLTLNNTTPDPIFIHDYLKLAKESGAKSAVLEATSQGLVQRRTSSMHWDAAVFTNLTHDHLDLHGSLETYAEAKRELFFRELKGSEKQKKIAAINIDDPVGAQLASDLATKLPEIRVVRVSPKGQAADLRVLEASPTEFGSKLLIEFEGKTSELRTQLLGAYNVENVACALSLLLAFGHPIEALAAGLEKIPPVPGRLELVSKVFPRVFVDYAHTPDALEKAQASLRPICEGRLITVFGCGGDRDRTKRPKMGRIVGELSDLAVITSDNPRTEDPERIIDEILPGVLEVSERRGLSFERIANRRDAIRFAIENANENDVILIAGKGHEDYQEIHGVKHPFLDSAVSREILEKVS